MHNYDQVTWVEHWEVEEEDKAPIHELYRDLIHSGRTFGAERWLSTLERICERYACMMVSGNSSRDLGGGQLSNYRTVRSSAKTMSVCYNRDNVAVQ